MREMFDRLAIEQTGAHHTLNTAAHESTAVEQGWVVTGFRIPAPRPVRDQSAAAFVLKDGPPLDRQRI